MYEKNINSQRDNLINENISLVTRIVNYLKPRIPPNIDYDDMMQIGILGLISAADNYKENLGVTFVDYAKSRVKGSIIDEVRKMSDISRLAIKNTQEHNKAIQFLTSSLERTPTSIEVAQYLNISINEYEAQRTHAERFKIDTPAENDSEYDIFDTFLSDDSNPLDDIEIEDIKYFLTKEINKLSERERQILQLYYYEEFNLKEIAEIIGVVESRISQILTKTIKYLRTKVHNKITNVS
jgi:RNA polymerase sigma factor for flagellar operon FliA